MVPTVTVIRMQRLLALRFSTQERLAFSVGVNVMCSLGAEIDNYQVQESKITIVATKS